MGRAVLTLNSPKVRATAKDWIDRGPQGTRVSFAGPQRTIAQNSKLWPCLTDISLQAEVGGKRYTPEGWKKIFLDAYADERGKTSRFLPKLDGTGYFPEGHSSSELSTPEMIDLLTLIIAWGDANGVEFSERPEA